MVWYSKDVNDNLITHVKHKYNPFLFFLQFLHLSLVVGDGGNGMSHTGNTWAYSWDHFYWGLGTTWGPKD